ncbi:MAG TPA: hypothetical protein VMB81_09390, partial [Candidatus Sulfotelmatobacter sp.]|nr:hypothetical protein [Candidatus Sulfotelmatobacter sp.]
MPAGPDEPDRLLVPASQHTLADAAYHRDGNDLILTDGAGTRTVVDDFFAHERLPHLVTPDGATLPGDFAAALAGQPTHMQLAQAGGAGGEFAQATGTSTLQPIGRVDVIQGSVTDTHVDGTKAVLAKGDPVYMRDLLEAHTGGSVGLILDDKTTFALGEGGRMRLDELVYNPASKAGSLSVSILKGTFVFVSGDIAAAHSDAMAVRTPVGTIGIRGTAVGGNITSDGVTSTITLLEDPRGFPSAVEITNASGTQYLTVPNQTVSITGFFSAPSEPFIAAPGTLGNSFNQLLHDLPAVAFERPAGAAGQGASQNRTAAQQAQAGQQGDKGGAPPHAGSHGGGGGSEGGGGGHGGGTLKANALDTTQAPTLLETGSPHVVTYNFFTLGHDQFTHQDGNNAFDAYKVANSLQWGDLADGGTIGNNTLIARFQGLVKIDGPGAPPLGQDGPIPPGALLLKNIELITFVLLPGSNVTLDAVGILAAHDGTTLRITGSGTITIDHAHDMTIDLSQFDGSYTINLDPDAGLTLIPGSLAIGGGITGSATINAQLTTVGKILIGTPGADSLGGGSGADTFVGLGNSDTLSGGGDNDVYLFGHGAEMPAGLVIQAGAHAALANGQLGYSEIRFESTTPGDTLHLTSHLSSPDNLIYVEIANDPQFNAATYDVPGFDQGDRTGLTNLAIDASAAPLPLVIKGNDGNDTLIASNSGDTIITGTGSNFLQGGLGADSLNASAAAAASKEVFLFASGAAYTGDTIVSGANTNEIRFTSTTPGDTLTLNSGVSTPNHTLLITASNDTVSGEGLANLTGVTPLAINASALTLTGGVTIDANNGGDQIVGTDYNDTINGGTGNDTIGGLVSGGVLTYIATGGNDSILTGAGNDLIVADVGHLVGTTVDGGAGNDELRLIGGGALNMTGLPLSNIETLGLSAPAANGFTLTVDGSLASFQDILSDATLGVAGANGNDAVTLVNYLLAGGTVDLGAGNDTLGLFNGANNATVINVETINLGAGGAANVLTLANSQIGVRIDGSGALTDKVVLNGVGNSVDVQGIQTLIGSAGNDTVALLATLTTPGNLIDLGSGSDTLTLANGVANSVNVANIESIDGGSANDTVVLTTALVGGTVDLGAGSDTLSLANGANSIQVANVESLLGGSSNDTIVLTSPIVGATIDLGAGSDTLTLANGTNSITVANVESILGGSGNDTIVLTTSFAADKASLGGGNDLFVADVGKLTATSTIDGGAGSDTLQLTDTGAANVLNMTGFALSNIETLQLIGTHPYELTVDGSQNSFQTINGSAASGNDTLVLVNYAITGGSIDLGGGADTLTLSSSGANSLNVANVESILGGSQNDTVVLSTALVGGTIDLGSGADTLSLANGANSINVANVESLLGGTGNDTIVLTSPIVGSTIDLGSGSDTLTLANGINSVTVANTESILGGTGADTVVLTTVLTGGTIDLGSGVDTLTLANGANSINVANVESLLGGTGNDTIVLTAAIVGSTIDLGSGSDTLTLANGANSLQVANVESILGGTGNDTIVLTAAIVGSTIDLGSGSDTLTLANGINSVTVANTESILGGTGADTVVLTTVLTGGTIDLSSGADTLTLANGANSINVANVESLLGGTGNDTIVLTAAIVGSTIDLGSGSDTLTLANGANSIQVANVESLLGGTGNDTIVLTAAIVGSTIDLGSGSDTLTLANGINSVTVANTE